VSDSSSWIWRLVAGVIILFTVIAFYRLNVAGKFSMCHAAWFVLSAMSMIESVFVVIYGGANTDLYRMCTKVYIFFT
jgi:hypothetical protein